MSGWGRVAATSQPEVLARGEENTMSEDYKKIALEDVKKGQRVRVVQRHRAYTFTYEGAVLESSTEREEIYMGLEGDEYYCPIDPDSDFDIFLLEDVPKPKVVRTETVTITHYDDGTKTETPVKDIKDAKVPMRIDTWEQLEAYEFYLRAVILRDADWDYWTYRDGVWGRATSNGTWSAGAFDPRFPLAAVDKIVD